MSQCPASQSAKTVLPFVSWEYPVVRKELKMMKRRTALIISAALCVSIWAAACIPIHPRFHEAAFDPSFQYHDAVRAYFDRQGAAGPPEGDTVYWYTASSLIGGDQIVLFFPWVEPNFRDVGTAGSSDWSMTLHASALSWDGETLSPSQAARPGSSSCVVQPGENTVLTSPYSPDDIEEIPQAAWGNDDALTFHVHASTEDSAVSPNGPATASARWSGEFYIRRTLWPAARAPFSVLAEETCLSNVK